MATQTIDLLKNSSFETKLDAVVTAITNSKPADGFSPTVTVSKVGDTATISVTDKKGTTTATIKDGTGSGDMQESNYATINPANNYVDKAINSTQLNGQPASYYAKNVDMTGASATTVGVAGLVPAPAIGAQDKFLRGDGSWQTVTAGTSAKYNDTTERFTLSFTKE